MAGGLDITNLKIVALFKAFGINIWNKGGQGISTQEFNNAYGRITVFGSDSVHLALIDEFGTKFASHTGVNRMTGFEVKNSTPTSSVQFDASHPASGVYYYRMQAGDFADVKKFVVLK